MGSLRWKSHDSHIDILKDFYNLTKINYIYFTKEGSFAKLIELVGKKMDRRMEK